MNQTGRDEHGRYARGNSGGPGRPKARTEEQYLAVVSDTVSLDDWRAVIERAVDQARAGDYRARQWLANYLIGRPKERAELRVVTEELLDLANLTIEETAELSRLVEKIEGTSSHETQLPAILSDDA